MWCGMSKGASGGRQKTWRGNGIRWALNWALGKRQMVSAGGWGARCEETVTGSKRVLMWALGVSWRVQVKQFPPTKLLRLIMLIIVLGCFTKHPRQMFRPMNTDFSCRGLIYLLIALFFYFARKVFCFAKQKSHHLLLKGTVLGSAGFTKLLPTSSCSLPGISIPVWRLGE